MSSAANTPTFPQFRRFPKEIRLSIWERAIPESRIVHIVQDAATRAMKSYTSIPAILRVNSESLSVASKHYRRAFRSCQPGQDQPDKDTSYVWFDFERDFLLIDYNMTGELWASPEDRLANSTNPLLYTTVRWIPDDDVKRIKNLAWYTNPSFVAQNEHIWSFFTGLRQWFLVQELMGSENVLEPRKISNSKPSLRKIAKHNLTPSYDLSFWDAWGEEHVDIKNHKKATLPQVDNRVMINPSLKEKFREDKQRLRLRDDGKEMAQRIGNCVKSLYYIPATGTITWMREI
ncbi:hypothetical protein BOTNAR_0189g00010 [Botryotinia narcissicola]|uniref:2EXR domain-containing protein n=1 Tax=Botryotinia narcissicola TaxID=278944 RepID=A0A4Z1I8T0_9HELO|nr:hypothetical protein BOTNAR_0189g00010 [Botryotinia narcissicola]